jgi:hypothetical protein
MLKTLLIIVAALFVLAVTALLVFVYIVQNVEQPDYRLVRQDGDFELRDYPALTVAEVTRDGPRREALSAGFGPLARYIFAKERDGGKISMTAPVTQQPMPDGPDGEPQPQGAESGAWTVAFIMPAEATRAGLPDPASADVRLREHPPRRMAAVRFSGRSTDELLAQQRERLTRWAQTEGLRITSEPIYAYYNDPMTPGPLRRNEIMVEVVPR